MMWLFTHLWLIVIVIVYGIWTIYCLWDGVMWCKFFEVYRRSHHLTFRDCVDPKFWCCVGYGNEIATWLFLHGILLFVSSLIVYLVHILLGD